MKTSQIAGKLSLVILVSWVQTPPPPIPLYRTGSGRPNCLKCVFAPQMFYLQIFPSNNCFRHLTLHIPHQWVLQWICWSVRLSAGSMMTWTRLTSPVTCSKCAVGRKCCRSECYVSHPYHSDSFTLHHSDLLRHRPAVTISVVQLTSNLGDDILVLRGWPCAGFFDIID